MLSIPKVLVIEFLIKVCLKPYVFTELTKEKNENVCFSERLLPSDLSLLLSSQILSRSKSSSPTMLFSGEGNYVERIRSRP